MDDEQLTGAAIDELIRRRDQVDRNRDDWMREMNRVRATLIALKYIQRESDGVKGAVDIEIGRLEKDLEVKQETLRRLRIESETISRALLTAYSDTGRPVGGAQ